MDISDSTLAPRTLLFLFTCGTVVGCAATDQPPEQPDETPSVDTSAATPVATPEPITQDTTPQPLDPAAFREQVRLELADLTNGTTPDMWMVSHPNDEMRRFEYDPILAWGGWCVRMLGQVTLPDGGQLTRDVHFYPPSPPADLQLPEPADGPRLALGECRLGSIYWSGFDPRRQLPGRHADVRHQQPRFAIWNLENLKSLSHTAAPPPAPVGADAQSERQ